MIARLDEETAIHHAKVDEDFDPLFASAVDLVDYRTFLVRAYGFESPVEAMLAHTPRLEHMIDLGVREKAGLLAADLTALGMRPAELAQLPTCLGVPQFRGPAEALGWLYVVERAALTHSVMLRHLQTILGPAIRDASSYLDAYAGIAGTRWRELGILLDTVGHEPAVGDRMVDAATEAFRTQRRWNAQDDATRLRIVG